MNQVVFSKVSKVYHPNTDHEVKALNNVSFTLKQGEFVVILGASGAGKSTLLNVLGGMDNITSGTITIADHTINELNEKELSLYRRSQVGFVFQFYNLIPNLTALENVQIAATLSKNALDSEETLSKVGLSHRLKNFPSELSGGEQQRVAIARAIVKNPDILLCDEPTGALDSKTGEMIIALLHKIARDYKKTVIVVTHNEKIASHANRLIRIGDGKIISNKEL